MSCDWTVVPAVPGNGVPGPWRLPLRVTSAAHGTPMSWRLGRTSITRSYGHDANPCTDQTLRFRGDVPTRGDALDRAPFALVEIGRATTALAAPGSSLSSGEWTHWRSTPVDRGWNFSLACGEGNGDARATVTERRLAEGEREARIAVQRCCPAEYCHLMVNIRAGALLPTQ